MTEWIQTYSGGSFDYTAPRPDDVKLIDIAEALSKQCRFAGHTTRFYSVAEHSFKMSCMFDDQHLAQLALLHDAAEAYVVDLPRPLKQYLRRLERWAAPVKLLLRMFGVVTYDDVERSAAQAIGDRFLLDLVNLPPEIKHADRVLLATEKRDVMAPGDRDAEWIGGLPEPLKDKCDCFAPGDAARLFMERAKELGLDFDSQWAAAA